MFLKISFLYLIVALDQAGTSLADFRGGRVEPGFFSEMHTVRAGGVFEGRENARVELNFEDGRNAPVSFTLKVPGLEPAVLPMVRVAPSSCGDHYVAVLADAQSFVTSRLELVDYSTARCRIFEAFAWKVRILHSDDDGRASEWLLEGRPEPVLKER